MKDFEVLISNRFDFFFFFFLISFSLLLSLVLQSQSSCFIIVLLFFFVYFTGGILKLWTAFERESPRVLSARVDSVLSSFNVNSLEEGEKKCRERRCCCQVCEFLYSSARGRESSWWGQ